MCRALKSAKPKAMTTESRPAGMTDAQFKALAENMPSLCWVADASGFIFWYNKRWYTYTGTTPAAMEGWGWQSVHDPAVLPSVLVQWTASIATGAPFEMTFPIKGADGVFRPFLTQIAPLKDDTGKVTGWVGTNTDISAQVAAESARKSAEEQFHTFAQAMPNHVWSSPPGGQLDWFNDRVYEFSGAGPGELDGSGWGRMVHPDDIPGAVARWSASLASGETYETQFRLKRHDGVYRWYLARAVALRTPSGEILRWIGTNTDIDDQKAAEDAHRMSEKLLRDADERLQFALSAGQGVGTWDWDVPGDRVVADARFAELYGVDPEHARTGAPIAEFFRTIHPDDQPEVQAALAETLRTGHDFSAEYRLVQPDGSIRWVIAQGRCSHGPDGQPLRFPGVTFDITKSRHADALHEALAQLSEQIRELDDPDEIIFAASTIVGETLRVSRVGYGTIDPDADTLTVERDWLAPGVETLAGTLNLRDYGSFVDDLKLGKFIAIDDVDKDPRTAAAAAALKARRAGSFVNVPVLELGRLVAVLFINNASAREWQPEELTFFREVADRARAASERVLATAALRVANETLEAKVEERTAELMAAEQALRQSQKMEAVGQLTGGIAHDFNNMLTIVLGSLEMLKRRVGDDERSNRFVDGAMDGARRAALLTQRLLAFSRQQPLQPEAVDANKLVSGMSELVRRSLGADVRLETVFAGGLWRTSVDPNQLENVILNLAVNARDAMAEGGKLTIETHNAHLDTRYAAAHLGVPEGQYVMVAVSDTGAGMSPEVIAKAFDPFFTTKAVGKGTGLGLSQVYGFVRQSGGHVKIYSEPGHGTTVKIYLPRLVGEIESVPDATVSSGLPLGEDKEVVLVVEDEPGVRQFSVAALEDLGYRVLQADGAAQALRQLADHPEIVLLFTDVVMPDVNGRKLADEARKRFPGLKVLYTTGYTRNAVVHNGVLDAGVQLIGKPFTIEELAGKVRSVLDQP
jgi:PAS domain S-box-containing protein